jgi:hypothetical protein
MRHAIKTWMFLPLLAVAILTACEKKDYLPQRPSTPGQPQQPADTTKQPGTDTTKTPAADSATLRLKVAIKVGNVLYDSIPFTAHIISFNGAVQVNQQNFDLTAGTNKVTLYGTHDRYHIRISKWGITDEVTVSKQELQTRGTIVLGGSKQAKRLQMEEAFTFIPATGSYHPQGKTLYKYDGAGRLIRAIFYQKYPQHADLQLTLVDKFVYEGGKLDRIERFDAQRDTSFAAASFTTFNYDGMGRIAEIYNNQTTETAARVHYGIENRYATTTIDYYYDNNTSLSYTMKFLGGNKVADEGRSSLGHAEGGTYSYDSNINPYFHMNWADLYLSHESKNNVVAQQKSYSGAYPSSTPYKMEYSYDADGFPVDKITFYKSGMTGADVYKTKTVYTY